MAVETARLADVARLAGVSVMTVSNVVNNRPHVRPEMRRRVQAAIRELDYRPNAAARRLATGRTGTIALALPEINVPYFAELARALADQAQARGYQLLIEQTIAGIEQERAVFRQREEGLVDGVIFYPVRLSPSDLADLSPRGPIVLLGETVAPRSVDHVGIDNVAAARRATEHLLRLGRTRIAFLGEEIGEPTQTTIDRLAGYRAALAAVNQSSHRIVSVPWYGAADGSRAMTEVLSAGADFDAVLCRDDVLAFGALEALRRAGKRVPEDVAVVGWDDIALSAYAGIPLTSVRVDKDELAAAAFDLLQERIDGHRGPGRHRLISATMAIRGSAPDTDV